MYCQFPLPINLMFLSLKNTHTHRYCLVGEKIQKSWLSVTVSSVFFLQVEARLALQFTLPLQHQLIFRDQIQTFPENRTNKKKPRERKGGIKMEIKLVSVSNSIRSSAAQRRE